MLNELSSRFLAVLKYLIKEHEVSDNKDFASRISVSSSMITEIVKGRSNVGLFAIQNTVLQFPINSDWLLTGRGSMLRDSQTSEENRPSTTPISQTEESIIYKMYKEKEAKIEELLKENGRLEERIRQLESQNKEFKSHPIADNVTEAFTIESFGDYGEDSIPTKLPSTSKRSSAGKV